MCERREVDPAHVVVVISELNDEVKETTAGDLPCQYVIHMVAGTQQKSTWKKPIKKCLEKAASLNLTSITFPALGTGT